MLNTVTVNASKTYTASGNGTFVYADGDGNETIADYTAGDDTIRIASGSISKTELVNGTDVKFTVGSGSVTVKNGKGKVISLEDSRGSYTVSDTRIALGKDFTGEMDASKYLSTVTNIAGGNAITGVTLRGNGNDNVMAGGSRSDVLYGDNGNDKLYGYAGNDTLLGQAGNDKLYGGAGKDKLYGGSGDDTLYGGDGNDILDGYTGDDTLFGGAGDDSLSGSAGKDTFVYSNGEGNDTVTDYAAGDDTIRIASGSISGAELVNGTDVKFTVGSGNVTVKNGKGKVISLEDSCGSYTVSDTRIALGKDFTGEMDASKYLSTVTNIAGGNATSGVTLRGNGNDNVMAGGAQSDILYGDNGNDMLYGYAGNDVLYGQAGNDKLYGGAGADKLYGGSGNDTLHGDAGNDILNGYTGDDTLFGGAGDDSLYGGAGKDKFVYANGDGNDTITDYIPGDDTIKITSGSISKTEFVNGTDVKYTISSGSVTIKNGKGKVINLTDSRGSYTVSDTRIALGKDFKGEMDASKFLSTVTNIAGSGATTAATLRGNGNDNVMAGGAQADTLYGDNGNDKLYGYGGNDTLFGQAGNDSLYGGDGKDKLYGGSGDDVLYGQAGNDTLVGYTGNDKLYGGDGDDVLSDEAGTGFLYGEAGNDTIKVSGGYKSVINGGTGVDKIYITGGSEISVDNSGGNDYIEIGKNAGNSFKVESGASASLGYNLIADETVKVLGGNNHDIRLYGGDDKIIIAGGENHIAYTDGPTGTGDAGGNDTIVIQSGGHVSKIVGGNGDDVIAVANGAGDGSTIYTGLEAPNAASAGTGSNTVNLLGGSGHTVYLGGSQNTVMVEAQDVTLNKLYGTTDDITVRWSEEGTGTFRINCPTGTASAQSTLRIEGVNSLDFKFEIGTVNVQTGNSAAGYASQSLIMKFSGMYFRNVDGYSGDGIYRLNDTANTRVPVYINDDGFAQYNWCAGNQQISYTSAGVAAADMDTDAIIEIARWGSFKGFGGIQFDDGFKTFSEINTVANSSSHEFPRFG